MRKRRLRYRPKKRFFIILAVIALICICISIAKNLNVESTLVKDIEALDEFIDVDKIFKVCIDAGHGGYDPGTQSFSGILEKDINLKVALELGKILEQNNIETVYTRTSDKVSWPSTLKEDLQARCDISNNANADIFLTIHCNFDEVSPKTRGVETWCRFPNTEDEKLAKIIQRQLVSCDYTEDRGLRYESDGELYVLRNTEATSVLVELGFLSNLSDTKFLNSENGQRKCAKALAEAIVKYRDSL